MPCTWESYLEVLSLSTAGFRDGASSLLDVLDAQGSVADAQENVAAAVRQSTNDHVALNVVMKPGTWLPLHNQLRD